MKRALALGTMGVLLAASLSMPVSAHGHHYNRTAQVSDSVCEICTVEGCDKTGLHTHDDVTYCGYTHGCGYCDGSCGAVAVCTVEGCDKTGRHTHDGETYCGYAHGNGYCDGSCAGTADTKTGRHCGRMSHHRR